MSLEILREQGKLKYSTETQLNEEASKLIEQVVQYSTHVTTPICINRRDLRVSNNSFGDRIVDGTLDRLGLRNHIRLTGICKQR